MDDQLQPQPTHSVDPGNRMVYSQPKSERLPVETGIKVMYGIYFLNYAFMGFFVLALQVPGAVSDDTMMIFIFWPLVALYTIVYACMSLGFSVWRSRRAKKAGQKPAILDLIVQASVLLMLLVPAYWWWYAVNISHPRNAANQAKHDQEFVEQLKDKERIEVLGNAAIVYVPVEGDAYQITKSGYEGLSEPSSTGGTRYVIVQYHLAQKSSGKAVAINITSNRTNAAYCFSATDFISLKQRCKDITSLGVKAGKLYKDTRGSYAYVRETLYYEISGDQASKTPAQLSDQEVIDLVNSFQAVSSGSIKSSVKVSN